MVAVLVEDTLLPEAVDAYDREHLAVPPEVMAAIEAAGVDRWRIWRDGTRLVQLIECDDWQHTKAILDARTPEFWVERMRALVDPSAGAARVTVLSTAWRFK